MSFCWSIFLYHPFLETQNCPAAFGEFVTVYRSSKSVHGCMGWWDSSFQPVPLPKLIKEMQDSFHNALFVDSRHLQFENLDVYLDKNSCFHFQWMLCKPMIPLANQKSILDNRFDPKHQGILMQQTTSSFSPFKKRATYLPDVFPTESLSYILKSLQQKADYPSSWLASSYHTQGCSIPISEFWVQSKKWLILHFKHIVRSIGNLILMHSYKKNGKWFIPFKIDTQDTKISFTSNEWVRSLSLLEFLNEFVSTFSKPPYQKWKNLYKSYLRQFELSQSKDDVHSKMYSPITTTSSLDWKSLDTSFGLPQFLLRNPVLSLSTKEWDFYFHQYMPESIFSWNWWTQVNRKCCKGKYTRQCENTIRSLWDDFTFPLEKSVQWLSEKETNEIAVVFEGTCALPFSLRNQRRAILCLQELGRRKSMFSTNFYPFKNGECRLDITHHVLHGMQLWISSKFKE